MLSIMHMPAPKSHSLSVELAEHYLKVLVDGLKVTIMGRKLPQEDRDLVVEPGCPRHQHAYPQRTWVESSGVVAGVSPK